MLINVILLFLKLGVFSIGGGYALMSLILTEGEQFVGLTAGEFADMAALELLASGPIAINAATYVGYIKAGLPGSIGATLGVLTPAFILCVIVYYFLMRFKESLYLNSFLNSIKIATGGLMLSTACVLGKEIFLTHSHVPLGIFTSIGTIDVASLLLSGACLYALVKLKLNPITVILSSAVAGMLFL